MIKVLTSNVTMAKIKLLETTQKLNSDVIIA